MAVDENLAIRSLSSELWQNASNDLHEDPHRRATDVQAIKEWLKKQHHIRANPDDQTIISFLRGCKFSLERTKEKLDMHYTLKTALPEFFQGRDFENKVLREILDMGYFFPLPDPDDKGRRVFITRPGVNDPNKYSQADMFKVSFMVMDMIIRKDDRAIVNGIVNILDMDTLSMGHIVQMTPSFVKKVSLCFEEAFPIRPKAQHFINTPSFFDIIYNLFNSFAKEKIRKRNTVHGKNLSSLHLHVPQNLLPNEYGGEAGTLAEINAAFVKELLDFNSWFLADAECGVDEKKRPGKPKTTQELFGVEGSFRQLSVD